MRINNQYLKNSISMIKLKEILMYGDSEPLEIILCFIMLAQLCYPTQSMFCVPNINIHSYYYYIGVVSSIGLLVGNLFNMISLRKWSANISFVVILTILYISLKENIYNTQLHFIYVSELIALFWITWRCSREEVSKLMRLLKKG